MGNSHKLHDAPRPTPHIRLRTPLRPRTMVQCQRPTGLASQILPQSRLRRNRIRPNHKRIRLHKTIQRTTHITIRQHRHMPRTNAPLVSPHTLETYHAQRTNPMGQPLPCIQQRSTTSTKLLPNMEHTGRIHRQRTISRHPATFQPTSTRRTMVARCMYILFPNILKNANPDRLRQTTTDTPPMHGIQPTHRQLHRSTHQPAPITPIHT